MYIHLHVCSVAQGDGGEGEAGSQLGHYWKQLAVVAVSSIFMFIYEFCER